MENIDTVVDAVYNVPAELVDSYQPVKCPSCVSGNYAYVRERVDDNNVAYGAFLCEYCDNEWPIPAGWDPSVKFTLHTTSTAFASLRRLVQLADDLGAAAYQNVTYQENDRGGFAIEIPVERVSQALLLSRDIKALGEQGKVKADA